MTEAPLTNLNDFSAATGSKTIPLIGSEQQFRAVLEASPDGFLILRSIRDADDKVIDFIIEYTNPVAARGVNLTQAALAGQHLLQLFPDSKTSGILDRYIAVAETGISDIFETCYDGKEQKGWFRNVVVKLPDGVAVSFSNITDRKQAELALQQQEQHFRVALQTAKLGSWEHDLSTGVLSCSAQCKANFGLPPDAEFTHETLFAALHPDDRPMVQAAIQRSIEHRTDYEVEERCYHPDGSLHWLIVKGQLVYDSDGMPIRLVGVTLDITPRKLAEETLRQSEERLRIAQQAANAGVWNWDVTTNRVTWSEEYYHLYGLDPATTPPSYENWLSSIIEQDRDRINQATQAALKHRIDLNVEFRILHPTQGERWLTAIGQTLFDENGQPIRMTGIALDITRRKQAEQTLRRYQLLSEYSRDIALYISQDGQILEANQAAVRAYGYPRSKLLSMKIADLRSSDSLPLLPEQFEQASQQGILFETVHQRQDGSQFPVEVSAQSAEIEGEYVVLSIIRDITQRKKSDVALRKSEEWAQLAIQVGRLGGWRLHLETNCVEMDERMREIWGESEDTVMLPLEKVIDRIYPDDRARVTSAVNAAIDPQSAGIYEIEYRIVWNDGTERWVLAKGQAQFDGEGQSRRPIDFFGTLLDITDRKQAEESLRNSAERLSVALVAAKLGDWSWSAATDVVTFSEQAAAMFGIPAGPYMTWTQMQTLIHPDDREQARLQVEQAIVNRSDYDIEYRVIQPHGSERWIAAKGRAQYDTSGRVLGMLGVVQDITDRKQAEAEREQLLAREQSANETLERFIEHTPVAVAMLDREMRYLCASRRWMQEYAPNYSSLKGRSHYEVMTDVPDRWKQVHQRCLAGASERCAEDYYLRNDGSAQWLYWEILPWYATGGEIGGIIIFAENITERKQTAQEREKLLKREQAARREAEQANRIKDEFLAVLSHELRSPLNPILGWVKLLQTRQFGEAETRRALATIERNAKLQTQLIDDLLDVSRILRGKLILNVAAIDLATVVDGALETVRLSAEAKGIEIQKVVAGKMEPFSGDPSRLQQIVWNLLSNAVKFTPSQGRIEIRLERIGTEVHIQVRDSGKGITPEFLPYVFDYFRQEDGTTTRRFGGLGLGLAIVRYLTELHGGTVQAESPGEGQGATFTVRLPLQRSARLGDGAIEVPDSTISNETITPTTRLSLTGIRILGVDDDADMRELMVSILQQAGADTIVVASATEALAVIGSFKPDVLVSDVGMPNMDGYELIRQIRDLPCDRGGQMPAIALTAYAGEVNQQKALMAGFQRHIAKPVEPEELIQAIIALVQRQ